MKTFFKTCFVSCPLLTHTWHLWIKHFFINIRSGLWRYFWPLAHSIAWPSCNPPIVAFISCLLVLKTLSPSLGIIFLPNQPGKCLPRHIVMLLFPCKVWNLQCGSPVTRSYLFLLSIFKTFFYLRLPLESVLLMLCFCINSQNLPFFLGTSSVTALTALGCAIF